MWPISEYGNTKGVCSQCGVTVCKGNARSGISLAKLKSFERHLQTKDHFDQYGGTYGIPSLGIFPQAGISETFSHRQQQIQLIGRRHRKSVPVLPESVPIGMINH